MMRIFYEYFTIFKKIIYLKTKMPVFIFVKQ